MENADLIVLLAPPRSGLRALAGTLSALGFAPLLHPGEADGAATLHALLERELDLPPKRLCSPPPGWEYLPSVRRIGERACRLLSAARKNSGPFLLNHPDLTRFLPLWLEAIEEVRLNAKFIHLVRHPFPVAQSISQAYHVDPRRGLALWDSCHREILYSTPEAPRILFESLLEEPLESLFPVCPAIRPDRDQRRAALRAAIPDLPQYGPETPGPGGVDPAPYLAFYRDLCKEPLTEPIPGMSPEHFAPAKLLKYGEEHENASLSGTELALAGHSRGSPGMSNGIIGEPFSGEPVLLTLKYGIRDKQDPPGDLESREILTPDRWIQIHTHELKREDIYSRVLLIVPLERPGVLLLEEVQILNSATNTGVWSTNSADGFEAVKTAGDARRLTSHDGLALLVTGPSPEVRVHLPGDLPDCPLQLTLRVKAFGTLSGLGKLGISIIDRTAESLSRVLIQPDFWENKGFAQTINLLSKAEEELARLEPYLYAVSPETRRTIMQDTLSVTEPESAYRHFLPHLVDGNTIHLKEAVMHFPDLRGLWVCLEEIFIQEEYFFEAGRPDPVILDCGSNIGISLYYFKHCYPEARITAFEPAPETFEILKKNIQAAGWKDVEALPYALTNSEGTAEFFVSESVYLAGTMTDRRKMAGDTLHPVTVETRRLGPYLEGPVDFLKLDIEGSEYEVLEDVASHLHNVRFLFCEYHHGLGMDSSTLTKILDILDHCGFEYHLSKSVNYTRRTSFQPMKYLGEHYSVSIYAKNSRNC